MWTQVLVSSLLFIITAPGSLIFIFFIIKNYDEISQRISNLVYFELAIFHIFYSVIVWSEVLLNSILPDPVWLHEFFIMYIRTFTVIVNFIFLLELSILTILRQHFMETYLTMSLKFSWSPYLVFKTIATLVIQFLVIISSRTSSKEDVSSEDKLLMIVDTVKTYVVIPVYAATVLVQAVIILSWSYKSQDKILQWFNTIKSRLVNAVSPQPPAADQVIELAVVHHQNWVGQPILPNHPAPNINQPNPVVQDSEVFNNLVSTSVVLLYGANIIIISFVGYDETILIRDSIIFATISATSYSWIVFNSKLRNYTKLLVNDLWTKIF